jgi:hypothetical protein
MVALVLARQLLDRPLVELGEAVVELAPTLAQQPMEAAEEAQTQLVASLILSQEQLILEEAVVVSGLAL